jgi:hypothetical protein
MEGNVFTAEALLTLWHLEILLLEEWIRILAALPLQNEQTQTRKCLPISEKVVCKYSNISIYNEYQKFVPSASKEIIFPS